jgi:hypothetical protein
MLSTIILAKGYYVSKRMEALVVEFAVIEPVSLQSLILLYS